VTVAVIDLSQHQKVKYDIIPEGDLKSVWFSGTGAGGQHRNKRQNSIRLTHLPTGITVTAQCRSRESSKKEALENLLIRLQQDSRSQFLSDLTRDRSNRWVQG
jgi:peptide chain release factor 1